MGHKKSKGKQTSDSWMGKNGVTPNFPITRLHIRQDPCYLTHSLPPVQSAYPNINKHPLMSKKWRVLHQNKPLAYPGLAMQEQFTISRDSQSASPVDEGKIPNIYSCIRSSVIQTRMMQKDGLLDCSAPLLCHKLQHLEMMMG